ncbi:MAG TPA: DUF3943 domain-containing protein [Polyangiaceae bacterium]|nr:DUF3943 domain-containing protein [Polyangiaceae bacterium]
MRLPLLLAIALGAALSLSPARAVAREEDYFIDRDQRSVYFEPLYDGWFGSDRYPKRYARAAAENGAVMAFELFIYWYDPQSNTVDWQYPDLWTKITKQSVARFDDNLERTNWLLHPTAGAAHYTVTRINGFGVLPSFGVAATASALYEVAFEWREIISFNDLIVTPFGGMAVGEFFYHLGNYLNSEQARPRTLDEVTGPDEFGRRFSAVTLGLPRSAAKGIEAEKPPPLVPDDSLGLSSAYSHRFELSMGESFLTNDQHRKGTATSIGLSGRLVAMPGFLRPGHIATWFGDGNFTRFSARSMFDQSPRELELETDAHLFGYFKQDLRIGRGGPIGETYELAGHTGLHYVDRWLFDRRDQYAMVHLLGPVGTAWLSRGPARYRFALDVTPDFAAPYSLAYEQFARVHGEDGTKSSLRGHGYYYSFGVSAGAEASFTSEGFTANIDARYGRYESIEGHERMQEDVTVDPHLSDDILELSSTLAFEPPGTPVLLRVTGAHVGRRSHMAEFTVHRSDERLEGALGIHF